MCAICHLPLKINVLCFLLIELLIQDLKISLKLLVIISMGTKEKKIYLILFIQFKLAHTVVRNEHIVDHAHVMIL